MGEEPSKPQLSNVKARVNARAIVSHCNPAYENHELCDRLNLCAEKGIDPLVSATLAHTPVR